MLTLIIPVLLIPTTLVIFFRFINKKNKPPIFGVYKQRGKSYWFKFLLMFTILKLRQLINHIKHLLDVEFGRSSDGTVHIQRRETDLEQKYFLADSPTAVDAVYFNGMSKTGDVVICNLARRPGQVCDSFLLLKVNGEELLLSPCLPDTYQEQSGLEIGDYKIKGLTIQKMIPMRAWNVSYTGEMKLRSDYEKKVNVQMDLTWSSIWNSFNYDTQMSARCMANDLARENWSRGYFQLLKKFHQTHYEQMGYFKGTIIIDDKVHSVNMPCLRDHSFGPFRDWRTFHRYVYHFIFLENGDCMAIGAVSQPAILSHLTIGYFCRRSDQTVFPIESCDFQLYQHGEHQVLPKDYGFVFKTGNYKEIL
ncbi:unnamed protein product [Diatraea saccharalis]|uniref:Uncharacterized protein n=1 Tax=Diatraea saccharalis TaxID=40085 RepID=A0A9N9QYP7_9NEOP|nr:unnamed protein product [Diatraea saccharalis]